MKKELESIKNTLSDLCLISGLSGHEDQVRLYIQSKLKNLNLSYKNDIFGNISSTIKGNSKLPSIMLFAHMDQLGFIIKKIERNGLLRIERVGGVPEKTLPSLRVVVKSEKDKWLPGIIGNKSHHATMPEEKYTVSSCKDLFIDCGFTSKKEAEKKGIIIGCPVTYAPSFKNLDNNKVAGTSIDDRAGCSVILEVANELKKIKNKPNVHVVFSTQEEFNLRGVLPMANTLLPDIAIQVDIMLSSDTPDMKNEGDIELGKGPCMSLYSFHGRGTLNGLIPNQALVNLFSSTAKKNKINLQRSARTGLLTDSSYVQHIGKGVACIDMGFPVRYSHSQNEVCDLKDLILLKKLLINSIKNINNKFNFLRK
tara:strand:+ start:1211 stop:2311 length:1101 start_codon:yes stop_codon:yes gene_type:complete